jgi:polysaccharide biosynthesis protein PslH
MRLFVMTSRVPWPLEKGDKLRIYHQLRHLKKTHTIFLCCLADEPVHPDAVKALEKLCDQHLILPLSKSGIIWRTLTALFSDRPFQVHYFFSRKLRTKVYRAIEEFGPEHIYCQLIRCAEYVKHLHNVPKTLDYMDAFNKGIERRIAVSPWYLKRVWNVEARRLIAYENLIFEYFEKHIIISKQDQQLIYHPNRSNITVIPNGVDANFFSPRVKEKKFDLVFIGNMSYPPNVDCAQHLAEDILPRVRRSLPNCTLLIAGAEPAPQVLRLANDHVEVRGWMDDIRDAYASANVFAAPLRIGSGLQNKLLEAMSMEIPCATSSLANNALGGTHLQEVAVADDADDFAKLLVDLLTTPETAAQMAKLGRAFVAKNYSWQNMGDQLEELISSTPE